MGRLEKIVVITVLFLVAVILGVSLNSGADNSPGKGPLANGDGARSGDRKAGAERDTGPRARRDADDATASPEDIAPSGLLNSSVTPAQPGTSNASDAARNDPLPTPANPASSTSSGTGPADGVSAPTTPPAQFLATREGLEATASDEWMLYTWKQGDTFKDLAERLYGSKLHVARLRAANEGRDETKLAAGDKILVAVKPAAAFDVTPAQSTGEKKNAWAGGLYEVKSGDVLGTISQQVYGTSKSWKKIYDANRDVIGDDPNALKLGAKLRIPE